MGEHVGLLGKRSICLNSFFNVLCLSDFKDIMSNSKIYNIHLKLSRSISMDRLKKARTYRILNEE